MTITKPKLLALLLAAAYVAITCYQNPHNTLDVLVQVSPGLVLILFADLLGDYIGPAGHGQFTQATPAILLTIAGWIALLAIPFFAHVPPAQFFH